MKKLSEYFIRYMFVFMIFAMYVLYPMSVSAASNSDTLAGMRAELEALYKEKADAEHQQEISEVEKAQKNQQISEAYAKIEETQIKVDEAKKSIEDSNEKIAELDKQTKDLMSYYQILQGDNSYLEFITDSSSMTELIMRSDAIEMLSNYNQEKLVELENLIEENEQKQVELLEYEEELNNNITDYQRQLEEIDASIIQFSDISMDLDGEIDLLENTIQIYEDIGCTETETIDACYARLSSQDYDWYINNYGWLKPVTQGRISSNFGWRSVPDQSSYHSGIDIAVSEGTEVYPAAAGQVIKMVYEDDCGGNQIYIQAVINGEVYTLQYAHLLEMYVSVGDIVNVNDVIALSGGYSTASRYGGYDTCTTGAHLHFGVSVGAYTSWSSYTANLIEPPGFPNKGSWFYSRTQWFD